MTSEVIAEYITPTDEIQTTDGGITADTLLDEVSLYNLTILLTKPDFIENQY